MVRFRGLLLTLVLACFPVGALTNSASSADDMRPNILFISVDDMNCDSVGAFGCKLEGTTPHIDGLAKRGLRLEHAHVCVGNCMPSRNVMFSGRYPHNNRVEGFYPVRPIDYPVLADLMKAGGYLTGIRGKVSHSTPYQPYPGWDVTLDTIDNGREHPKDVQSYFRSTARGIAAAKEAGKPFCLLVNVSDPHKPFYGVGRGNQPADDPHKPSRIYTASEVPVPKFLPDDPEVRKELAQYYTTVRRADDCVGMILKALDESGAAKRTVIVFLSDHGMPLPFAKTQIYHHSTWTPWIVIWPGVTQPGSVDRQHMISAVDLLPTLLEISGLPAPQELDGRSFAPVLKGQPQKNRDYVFKVYNENSGGARHPMRGVQTRRYGYIFNPWSDGKRVFRTATTGTATYRRMKQLAATDPVVAARLKLFDHRVLEEFYDYEKDPDALHNLIDDPDSQQQIQQLRKVLEAWMVRTNDHALEAFRHRDDRQALDSYMQTVEAESAARRKNRRKVPTPRARRQARLLQWTVPKSVAVGKPIVIKIKHTLPADLNEQLLHVTLKDAAGKRIERKVVKISGKGEVEVSFSLPADRRPKQIQFAAFVGKDYSSHLQHLSSPGVAVGVDMP